MDRGIEADAHLGGADVGALPEHLLEREPVSYTHLRAHETVLDLVCRLLLENKKTKVPESRTTRLRIHVTSLLEITKHI
mgnify:CR=1 FL=1